MESRKLSCFRDRWEIIRSRITSIKGKLILTTLNEVVGVSRRRYLIRITSNRGYLLPFDKSGNLERRRVVLFSNTHSINVPQVSEDIVSFERLGELAVHIRDYQARAGLSRRDLAARLGCSEQFLRNILAEKALESGDLAWRPRISTIVRIAGRLVQIDPERDGERLLSGNDPGMAEFWLRMGGRRPHETAEIVARSTSRGSAEAAVMTFSTYDIVRLFNESISILERIAPKSDELLKSIEGLLDVYVENRDTAATLATSERYVALAREVWADDVRLAVALRRLATIKLEILRTSNR